MKRLVRDAVLIGATAVAVWVIRGDAQQTEPMGYGQSFQLVCTEGRISNAMASEAAMGRVEFFWWPWAGPESLRGEANLSGCVAYPDLRTPTDTKYQ